MASCLLLESTVFAALCSFGFIIKPRLLILARCVHTAHLRDRHGSPFVTFLQLCKNCRRSCDISGTHTLHGGLEKLTIHGSTTTHTGILDERALANEAAHSGFVCMSDGMCIFYMSIEFRLNY